MFRKVSIRLCASAAPATEFSTTATVAAAATAQTTVAAEPTRYATSSPSTSLVSATPLGTPKLKLSKFDTTDSLLEFRKKVEDPQGLPTTAVFQKPYCPDDYIYNRGKNESPSIYELGARCSSARFQKGQISNRSNLHMMFRHESETIAQRSVARMTQLAMFNNNTNSSEGTAIHYACKKVNPLFEDATPKVKKFGHIGKVTRAIRGGTYLHL